MQLKPEEYIEIPEKNRFVTDNEPKFKYKSITYHNFVLNDIPPKEDEKYFYITYRTN